MPIWILLLWPALAQDSLDSRDANLLAARAYVAQGNFAKAAESLDLALAANPDAGSEPYLTLIECRLKLDQKEKALEAAERGVKRYPVSGPLLKAAGALILQERSSSERAGELLERAAKAMRQDPGAHAGPRSEGAGPDFHRAGRRCFEEAAARRSGISCRPCSKSQAAESESQRGAGIRNVPHPPGASRRGPKVDRRDSEVRAGLRTGAPGTRQVSLRAGRSGIHSGRSEDRPRPGWLGPEKLACRARIPGQDVLRVGTNGRGGSAPELDRIALKAPRYCSRWEWFNVVVSNAGASADNAKCRTAVRAISICAFSSLRRAREAVGLTLRAI